MVPISEPSFEGFALGENGFTFTVPGAWTGTTNVGTFNNPNSGTEFINGPPIGQDFIFFGRLEQYRGVIASSQRNPPAQHQLHTSPNLEYAACAGLCMGLYADGMLLGEVTQDDFALSNDFIDVMLTIDSRDFPSLLGESLEIRLTRPGATGSLGQLVADDFHLVALVVPEPSSVRVAARRPDWDGPLLVSASAICHPLRRRRHPFALRRGDVRISQYYET